ncbi:PAS domain S-box protein [Pseudomonas sp. GOM6]|uniref:PAS domain S-box protein n=1 Tax=Pseudomonas sp. GOM6 TaxID=3036944 RepID=UPI0024097CFE|nr:PAS domain S-box protein [Pseudomonas sp. GOM6]MDG1580186.1 PAS domain S-box protein [Pseudomonas sp. GOM6]
MKKNLSARWSIAWILLLGLATTVLIAEWLRNTNQQKLHSALENATTHAADAITERVKIYQYGLRGARGAVLSGGDDGITREAFQRYSQTRNLEQEFPGAAGFGFIRRVPQAEEGAFLARARTDSHSAFNLQQFAPHDGDRYVIQYIEPLEPNLPAVGLDIASDAALRSVALAAMQSGEARLTGLITPSPIKGETQQSLLILMPIYRTGSTPPSLAERTRNGLGWSYAPLSPSSMIQDLHLHNQAVHLRLLDITEPNYSPVLYEADNQPESATTIATHLVERDIFGRRWQIELNAYPGFAKSLHLTSPKMIYIAGGLLSLMLAALAGISSINRQRRRQIFAGQARLAAIVESSNDAIIGKTLDGTVTSWNRGAEKMFGYSAKEAIGLRLVQLIVPPQLAHEETMILQKVGAGETINAFETLRKRKDGRMLDVSAVISPIHDEAGQVVGISKTVRDITERKAIENKILELNASLEQQVAARTAELSELNVLLTSVLDSASAVAIIATDTAGTITVFNYGAQNLLGYSDTDMVGKQSPTLLHQQDELARRSTELSGTYGTSISGFRALVYLAETQGADIREWTYVRKDGNTFLVSLAVNAIRDRQGQLVGYLCIAVDVTEQREASRRLTDSLETTRAILDTAVNPVITFHADGRVQSFNPAAQQAFGYSADEMGERVLYDLISPSSRERLKDMIESHVSQGNSQQGKAVELTALNKRGTEFPIHLSIGSMPSTDQPLLVGVITDLSEQVALRKELLAIRDQLTVAAEVAQLGIWSWDLADNSLHWNERMFELYEQPPQLGEQGLRYEHWLCRIHPDDRETVMADLLRAIANENSYAPVLRVVRSNGQVRFIQAGAHVERNADGKPIRVIGINIDISAQHEVEAYLRYAKEQADAANAAKSTFLANMSHEIRTPLNAVLGMLQLVQATQLTPRQLDYVRKAHGAAKSLLGLLNDILDYSKIEAGKLQLELHPFELEPLMRDLAVILAGNQGLKDVEVMFDLDPNLPEALLGDSLCLQQILINLAGNALKFTEHGQVVVSLRQLGRIGQRVQLRVAINDTGIGISEEQLGRIFEGFTQAEASTSRRFGGTGLGLVICKRLIALMGGELQVTSQIGQGSSFWFDIELDMATQSSLRTSCSAIDSELRLLVVDDNAMAGELLLQLAADLGWHASYVDSGERALAAIESAAQQGQPFQIVLMDWRMPGMDGIDTARQLNTRHLERPPLVVMITAHGREVMSDIQHEGNAPFAAFLSKPVTPMQLSSTIERVLTGQTETSEPVRNVQPERLVGLNLLVVEDNALNRQVAQELLQAEGARVHLAEDGQAGVDAVLRAAPQYDAVLMDIQMPGMDGLQATRALRSHPQLSALPIIAMTANASQSDRQNCLEAGMNEHVGKPIDLEQLVQVLLHWTGRAVPDSPTRTPTDSAGGLIESRESLLRRFGNNRQLLRNMLSSFDTQMSRQLEQLAACATNNDRPGVLMALHTLKGSAGTMGASGLAAEAARWEHSFKHSEDSALATPLTDPTWLQGLTTLLASSVRELNEIFTESEPATSPLPASSDNDWISELQHLHDLLASGNLQALEQAQTLAAAVPENWRDSYSELLQASELLEFEQARQLCHAILTAVQGA